jgi:hypothetical protein
MSGEKKNSVDEVIERSIRLFGLTPEEISDRNVEWMQEKGYKRTPYNSYEHVLKSKTSSKNSRLENILKLLRRK